MPKARPTPREGGPAKPADHRGGEKAAASKAASPIAPPSQPTSGRAARAAERRQAIIDAALEEFISRGFTATRLDDVATIFRAAPDDIAREILEWIKK